MRKLTVKIEVWSYFCGYIGQIALKDLVVNDIIRLS
jgi:hypothetical protein